MANAAGMKPQAVEPQASYTMLFDYDGSGNLIYLGRAGIGSLTGNPVWQIKKLNYSGSNMTSIQWAGGNESFTNIWDNRASLSYS
ncbi:MAG: hypothetical protein KGJ89_04995 [Patescibacteria group bacterium]|nr:hypothetical protein [Patescibacteria group bacterium]MDE2227278.1 hypothetical protein [Patescibacteria group bacterium]